MSTSNFRWPHKFLASPCAIEPDPDTSQFNFFEFFEFLHFTWTMLLKNETNLASNVEVSAAFRLSDVKFPPCFEVTS